MALAIRLTIDQKQFIYTAYTELTAKEIALHLGISVWSVYKYLQPKKVKCKRAVLKRPIVVDRQRAANVLEAFCNNGYSIKLAALSCGISYQKASWYIKHYYTRKMLSESTTIITLKSKI